MMLIAILAGLATTTIAVLVGVAAAYGGGAIVRNTAARITAILGEVYLLPALPGRTAGRLHRRGHRRAAVIPLFPLMIVIVGYAHATSTWVLIVAITVPSWVLYKWLSR